MLIASVSGSRPDPVNKTQLLDLLQTQKGRTANNLKLSPSQRNQIIETITHSTDRPFVRQKRLSKSISPLLPVLYLHNLFLCSLFILLSSLFFVHSHYSKPQDSYLT